MRPLARRRFRILRPFLVAMRARNPWRFLRTRFDGWNVRFIVSSFFLRWAWARFGASPRIWNAASRRGAGRSQLGDMRKFGLKFRCAPKRLDWGHVSGLCSMASMRLEPQLDVIGAALGDASRSKVLCALMDGRAYTGKELSAVAGITAQTGSGHLARLVDLGLIRAERSGRCVYYALAGEDVAEMLEQVAAFTPLDHLDRSRRCRGVDPGLFVARRCYGHFGGRLSVLVAEQLVASGDVTRDAGGLMVAPQEDGPLVQIGICAPLAAKDCLDWTERKPHLSGPLGRAVMGRFEALGWVKGARGTRIMQITDGGCRGLSEVFNISRKDLVVGG